MHFGSVLLTVSLLLTVDGEMPPGPAPGAPNNIALPPATQQVLPPPAAPSPAAPPTIAPTTVAPTTVAPPARSSILPPPTPKVTTPPPAPATQLPAGPSNGVAAVPPTANPQSANPPSVMLVAPPSSPYAQPVQRLPAGVVSGAAPGMDETWNVTTGPWPQPVADANPFKMVWGEVDAKLFPDAGRMAPNGVAYCPLFSLDLDMNIWLWPKQGLYLFGDARFWGERGTPGQTQGNFDYTRREFDLTVGLAWNYYGNLELRFVGYSRENLNRGVSLVAPGGTTNDGAGVEQRLYLNGEYAKLGQDGYNVSRATFVSVGYYPTKSMIGADGQQFHPGAFARAYLTCDIPSTCTYVFLDLYLIADKAFIPRRLDSDVGLAFAPFEQLRMLEFRLGSEFNTGFTPNVRNMSLPYLSVRLNY
jgi:hypothetical protein